MNISAHELAALSEDVYGAGGAQLASASGWTLVQSAPSARDGFAASLYEKAGVRVLAIRGTEPTQVADLVADAQMLPLRARDVVIEYFQLLGDIGKLLPAPGGSLAHSVAGFLSRHFAALPAAQLSSALSFADQLRRPGKGFSAVTGHSLGGALAMALSQRYNLPAMSFNAPMIGELSGVIPMTSHLIKQVQRKGCPVAGGTRAMGSLPIGQVIELDIPLSESAAVGRLPNPAANILLALYRGISTLLELHSITPLRLALRHMPEHSLDARASS